MNRLRIPVSKIDFIPWIRDQVKLKRVLHIGCVDHNLDAARSNGQPWLHDVLAQSALHCIGIDINESDIARLSKEGYDTFVQDVQTPLNFAPGSFDVVVAGAVIEHLDRPHSMLQNIRSVLAPEGKVIITTANPFYVYNQITIALGLGLDINREHCLWFCPDTMWEMARRNGYVMTESYVYNYSQWVGGILRLPSILRPLWASSLAFVLKAATD